MGDYCTLADVKGSAELAGYIDMTSEDVRRDALIAKLISRTSRFIDNFTNTPKGWDMETVTERLRAIVDKEGNLLAQAGKACVSSVTSMSARYSPTDQIAVDVTSILTADDSPVITVWDGKWLGFRGNRLVADVTYTGGYSPLPDDIVNATVVLTARLFKAKDAGFADVVGSDQMGTLIYSKVMPREVQAALNSRRRVMQL